MQWGNSASAHVAIQHVNAGKIDTPLSRGRDITFIEFLLHRGAQVVFNVCQTLHYHITNVASHTLQATPHGAASKIQYLKVCEG